jgi:hypothetical protein
MTFQEIIERWRVLPRYPVTGSPIRASLAMQDFIRTLTAPNQRGWFEACHAWIKGGPSPDGQKEIDEILAYLPPFQKNMAQAHLDCARLVGCPCDDSFDRRIKAVAASRDSTEGFLLELVNEIRCGQPRQTLAPPVYIAYPLVWEERRTGELARFVLERLSADERLPGNDDRVFPAPSQAFSIGMDKQFQDTFNTALAAVQSSFTTGPVASRSSSIGDIRVSNELVSGGRQPAIISLEGASGGGALALDVAKCWADGIENASGEGPNQHHTLLRNLDLKSIAITAKVSPEGCLSGVEGFPIKPWEILLTREAQSHEVNVLVVAKDQDGFDEITDHGLKPISFLLPKGGLFPQEFVLGRELRSPESLLVIRAADLRDVVETLHELQANTLLSVLEKPIFIVAYLLAGSRRFPLGLVAVMFAGWYFLPGSWFILIGVWWVSAGIFFVRSKIRKIKRRAELCLLPQSTAYSPATWANMVLTLEEHQSDRSFKNICGWFKSLLVANKTLLPIQLPDKTSDERLTLRVLPWLWYRSIRFWLCLLIPALLLAPFSTPLQHCLAENLFAGTANILRGESRRGDGNNVRYAAFQSKCESGACLGRATIGSYGLIRLFLEHKPRASRFLRITRVDAMSYVKVDDDSPGSDQITIPVINDEAKFYYGIDENTPWEIELDVEVICYCGRSLRKARLTGNRAPPGE